MNWVWIRTTQYWALEDERYRYGVVVPDEFGRTVARAMVMSNYNWEPVPLPPGCDIEEAKRLVLATAALEA